MTMQTTRLHASMSENRLPHSAENIAAVSRLNTEPTAASVSGTGRGGAASNQEIRAYRVGSLRIFTGYNISVSSTREAGKSLSQFLDDCILIYQTVGEEASKSGASGVRIQSYACPIADLRLAGQSMLIHLPRSAFKGLEDRLDAICGAQREFHASPILRAYLESLRCNLTQLRESEQHVVEAMTVQIVRSSIVRTTEPLVDAASPASRNRLEAARRYIDEHLISDNLTVDSVQAWLGVSRRQLYALFEPYGGVARYILRQRLRRLHAFLSQSEERRPVGSVAEQFGIDPGRVQRLFREEFGYELEEARPKGVARPFEAKSVTVYESRVA